MQLRSALTFLTVLESIVATAAYAVVAGLLMVDVVGRELFATTFLGLQQLAVYGAIVAGFLGLTLATSDNAHLRPAFLDFLAGRHQALVARPGDVLSAGFFFARWLGRGDDPELCDLCGDFRLFSRDVVGGWHDLVSGVVRERLFQTLCAGRADVGRHLGHYHSAVDPADPLWYRH